MGTTFRTGAAAVGLVIGLAALFGGAGVAQAQSAASVNSNIRAPAPVGSGIRNDFSVRGRSFGSRIARTAGNPAEASEGQALAAKAGVACRTVDGRLLSSNGRERTYEIACKDGFGWLVVQDKEERVAAYDCLAIDASTKGERRCMLPANADQTGGLQALADKARTGCKVDDGQWLGTGGSPPISRYEAVCTGGGGYIFDTPAPGSKADMAATSCKDAEAFGMKCTLPGALKAKGRSNTARGYPQGEKSRVCLDEF